MAAFSRAADAPAAATPRVGLYDSRAIAFAQFWSDAGRQHRHALIAQARAARAGGDAAEFQRLNAEISASQKRAHLAVFSTAPAEEALAALQPALPRLLQELQVSRLVSKWDDAALQRIPAPDRVDVTDALVRELLPHASERQLTTLAAMKTTPPVPLDRAKAMVEKGEM